MKYKDLPLFPLNLVLLPFEKLPLYIFEPRYKIMVKNSIKSSDPFGIVLREKEGIHNKWWSKRIILKEKGLKILRSRIYELERQKRDDERSKDRKSKIGTGDRSERIRTYNFPQGRVTDHRINLTLHKLSEFMEGEIFDEMIENLVIQAQENELSNI